MSQIDSGIYMITPIAAEGSFISRHVVEDRSLMPKRVVLINNADQAQKWQVERRGSGFKLSISGGTIAPLEDRVFAHLLDNGENCEWQVEPAGEPGVFTVKTPDGKSWALPDTEEWTQLTLQPSSPGLNPNELFRFLRTDDY